MRFPFGDLADDPERVAGTVGTGRVAGEALVGEVGVVLEGAGRLDDVDPLAPLPLRQLAAPDRGVERGGEVDPGDFAVGNLLADGDQVTLIKDLEVKGAGQTLKRGTLIPSIRLTGDPQEIDCRYPGIKGLVLRAEFVRKR